jgi:hypothetical protein
MTVAVPVVAPAGATTSYWVRARVRPYLVVKRETCALRHATGYAGGLDWPGPGRRARTLTILSFPHRYQRIRFYYIQQSAACL